MVWLVALVAVIAAAVLPSAGKAGSRCKAPQELVRFKAPLNQLARAAATDSEIKIIALGSSSTAGAGAGNPRCLETALGQVWSRE